MLKLIIWPRSHNYLSPKPIRLNRIHIRLWPSSLSWFFGILLGILSFIVVWVPSGAVTANVPSTSQMAGTTPIVSTTANDDDFPIEIKSDTADFDEKTGNATHRGHVVVDQGTRHLTADTLIIHRTPEGKLDKMIAYGTPAQFHAYPAPGKPLLHGKSKTMRYFPYEDKIIFEEDAELTQDQKTIQGALITYFINTQILTSESNSNKRTTVIIEPKAPVTPEMSEKNHGQ